jgi:uncharacterized membrane protein (DUF106 family)
MASLGFNFPALIVAVISVVIGLLMVVVFRYTSDQKAIHVAKDHLKAHLLALRLFQDQIPVVIRSYGRILRATGRYLRLAFMPLLLVSVPLILLLAQIDRYLGATPLETGHPFLVSARVSGAEALSQATLELPAGLATTAPAVHVPAENEVVWRVVAEREGSFVVNIQTSTQTSAQTSAKQIVVGSGMTRLSVMRLRGPWWKRLLYSAEPALPESNLVQSIEVQYPSRDIAFAGIEWNWIWLFFVLSLAAGFLFKSVLGIEI